MSLDRVLMTIAALALLSGCHLFSKLTPDCHSIQEYQRAQESPPLKVPSGLDSPNTQGALVIPPVGPVPARPGANEACLDTPPRYKAAPPNKAASELPAAAPSNLPAARPIAPEPPDGPAP